MSNRDHTHRGRTQRRLVEEERRLVPATTMYPARLGDMPVGEVDLWTRLWDAVLAAAARGAISPVVRAWKTRLAQALARGLLTVEEGAFLRGHLKAAERVVRRLRLSRHQLPRDWEMLVYGFGIQRSAA